MWTRDRIKKEAKSTLRHFGYWTPFLVSLFYAFICGGISSISSNAGTSITSEYTYEYGSDLTATGTLPYMLEEMFGEFGAMIENFFSNPLIAFTTAFIIVSVLLVSLMVSLAWGFFVTGPIFVGQSRFYMEHRAFGSKFSKVFWCFKSGRYLNCVKIIFLWELKIFLWSLLFYIPGIIKSYEYRMVPYILAENPNIDSNRAFEISSKMTKGEKWKIFVLDLSFIGWFLLGILTCGIGLFFLEPYIQATYAELYQVMREKAHGLGFADYNELPGFFPEQK
ncbi:MAG: DUF975 family protein [Oscillospiraceae bacterium]|nr:DUF975 family protein [Oscillospiraceae bacterium]